MITIGDIVLWERLTHKTFQDFSTETDDDAVSMAYILSHQRVPLETYKKAVKGKYPKELRKRFIEIKNELSFFSQFMLKNNDDGDDDKELSIGDVTGYLIFSGMDAKNILSLGIEWLPYLSIQYVAAEKRGMESKRFWARILLSPYVSDNGMSIHKFLPFAWDKDDDISDTEIKTAKALFGKNKK